MKTQVKFFMTIALAILSCSNLRAEDPPTDDNTTLIKISGKKKSGPGQKIPGKDEDVIYLSYSNGILSFVPDSEKYPSGQCEILLYNMENSCGYPYIYTLPQEKIEISLPEVPAPYVINITLNNDVYSGTWYFTK